MRRNKKKSDAKEIFCGSQQYDFLEVVKVLGAITLAASELFVARLPVSASAPEKAIWQKLQ